MLSFIHTHSLTASLTHSLAHSLTYLLIHRCFRVNHRQVLKSEIYDGNVQSRDDIRDIYWDAENVAAITNEVVNSIINNGISSLFSRSHRHSLTHSFIHSLTNCEVLLGMNNSVNSAVNNSNSMEVSDYLKNHYVIPPTTLESLRKRYGTNSYSLTHSLTYWLTQSLKGTRKSVWGEWSNAETRNFYKQQLPHALRVDGILGTLFKTLADLFNYSLTHSLTH